jgi:uncharacterized protein YbgA (DUF1722 family)/uncharacterized protein YbbK (DUF523 family)
MVDATNSAPIRILVSACLLGDKVRFDGQHKRDAYIVETLGKYFEYVRVCPEVEAGLGVPRETMRLVGDAGQPRLVTRKSGVDLTDRMADFTRRRLDELADLGLCGYICKKDSPSSGMSRVKVYGASGIPERTGAGLFTRAFMARFPRVPVEEEGRLNDPVLREAFIQRVFGLKRWRDFEAEGRDRGRLVQFHTDHKLLLLTHGRPAYTALGRLVAAAGDLPVDDLWRRYGEGFGRALERPATRGRTTDVLMHMMGHFKGLLGADETQELLEILARYRQGMVPLVVPLTLFQHHIRKHGVAYLARQVFLNPHPVELMLRNHT